MTVSQLIRRINKYWYIILILPLITTLFGITTLSNRTTYRASITVGVSFNNQDFVFSGNENYDRQLNTLSEYLANRFKSTDVQKKIIDIIDPNGGSDNQIDAKKPFYEIVDQKSGYVNISAILPSQSEAKTFNEAIKTTYQNIVTLEKNQNELTNYKVNPMTNFSESVSEVKSSVQLQVLPTIIGLLLAILTVTILPMRS